MSKSIKKLVRDFYNSDAYKNEEVMKSFLHPEVELHWSSSDGFIKLDFDGFVNLVSNLKNTYRSLRADISHVIREDDKVCVRYTYHVRTIENPDEEMPLAHFMTIWEVKDGKLYRGYELSQLADADPVNLASYRKK
ncbi:nuclear transport factor 2 family protein [Sungkyunkwania multivorans]|uniref:Nuclear transport factor 2 family protein n=1 Tax=Sungkyunkwania multivorans TaxID=1173618 RepID=A0ABW3CZ73_9FLAO